MIVILRGKHRNGVNILIGMNNIIRPYPATNEHIEYIDMVHIVDYKT